MVGRISRSDRQIAETLLHAANRVGITEFAASVTAKQSERDAYLAQRSRSKRCRHCATR